MEAAPKRRRLVVGDEDVLAEEGKPLLASKLSGMDSDDGTHSLQLVRHSCHNARSKADHCVTH